MLAIYRAVAAAERSVYIADWFLSPDLELVRGADQAPLAALARRTGGSVILKDLLASLAGRVDVRVLLWGGSLLFHPTVFQVRATQRALQRASPHIKCANERVAFVGGIDLTDLEADRWDLPGHPLRARVNWHDVQLRLEGPAVADLVRNYRQRWPGEWAGEEALAPPALAGANGAETVQVLRTIPAGHYAAVPRGEYSYFEAYCRAIHSAARFLYIEDQYLWSPELVAVLEEAIQRRRPGPFRVVVVLPGHPNVGKLDTDLHVRRLVAADAGRGVFRPYTLYTSGTLPGQRALCYQPVYVHSKVLVADDTWSIVGSANLNGRSMAGDTELGVLVHGCATARRLRLGLWSEHLARPEEAVAAEGPIRFLDEVWHPAALAQQERLRQRRGPLDAHVLPYRYGRAVGDLPVGEAEAMVLDR
jgi:phosphatidylserine/phosphatidylglycerophosphate/cardiolipin synthase-like enzyme